MSRIDELIERLCPDGVEYKALGEIAKYGRDRIPAGEVAEGCYVGVNELLQEYRGRSNEVHYPAEERCIAFRPGDVLLGNIRPYLKKMWLADCEGGTNGDVLVIRINDTAEVAPEFLWQVLAGGLFTEYNIQHSKGAKMPRGDKKEILEAKIPFPPMEVQQEIVRVLDSFAELEAELEARRHQYVYYRDKLFDFAGRESVSWLKLGDSGTFTRGKRFTASDYVDMGIESIHYGEIYTRYGISATSTYSHLHESMRDSLRFAKNGDVIIAATGENVEDLCKSVAWLGDEEVAVHDDCWIFSSDMNPRYIVHALLTSGVAVQKKRLVSNGKVSRISGKNLASISVPVPSLEEQERIVTILNKFDTLVNGISQGIPAEIAARRKQYAYYRDKLLSFEEKVV